MSEETRTRGARHLCPSCGHPFRWEGIHEYADGAKFGTDDRGPYIDFTQTCANPGRNCGAFRFIFRLERVEEADP